MFNFKKIFLISFILFFIFIPKVSAKYIILSDVCVNFEYEIPEEEPFRIYNLDDLKTFRNLINTGERNFDGEDVYLMADIDLSSIENWIPIGSEDNSFLGVFHGNSYTISNLNIDNIIDNAGLFAINSGTITDLTVSGTIIEHIGSAVGGIVGKNNRNN